MKRTPVVTLSQEERDIIAEKLYSDAYVLGKEMIETKNAMIVMYNGAMNSNKKKKERKACWRLFGEFKQMYDEKRKVIGRIVSHPLFTRDIRKLPMLP